MQVTIKQGDFRQTCQTAKQTIKVGENAQWMEMVNIDGHREITKTKKLNWYKDPETCLYPEPIEILLEVQVQRFMASTETIGSASIRINPTDVGLPPFIKCTKDCTLDACVCIGPKPGYRLTDGAEGLGYYKIDGFQDSWLTRCLPLANMALADAKTEGSFTELKKLFEDSRMGVLEFELIVRPPTKLNSEKQKSKAMQNWGLVREDRKTDVIKKVKTDIMSKEVTKTSGLKVDNRKSRRQSSVQVGAFETFDRSGDGKMDVNVTSLPSTQLC